MIRQLCQSPFRSRDKRDEHIWRAMMNVLPAAPPAVEKQERHRWEQAPVAQVHVLIFPVASN